MERLGLAAGAVVAGSAAVAVSDNLVPLAAEGMGLWQLMVLRSLVALPVAVAFAWATGLAATLVGRSPAAVALRSGLIVAALLLYFAALPAVGIALAAAGMFTSPIWIVLLSSLVLGERIGPYRIAALGLGFAGVCLVLGVGSVPLDPVMVLPICAGLLYGLNVMVTRSRCAGESSICLATWQTLFFLGGGVAGLLLAPWLGRVVGDVPGTGFITMAPAEVTPRGLALAAMIGLSGLLGGGLLATGYRLGRSSVVGLFDYSFLVWAPLFGWLIRGEGVAPRTLGGMALIALAGVLAMRAGRRIEARQAPARRGG